MNLIFPIASRREKICGPIFLLAQLLIIPLITTMLCEFWGIVQTSTQNVLCFFLSYVFALGLFPHFWVRSLKDAATKPLLILRTVATYIGINYFCTILINVLIFYLDADFFNANDSAIAVMTSENKLFMFLGVVILVPPAEELLFRGFIFGRLYFRHPVLAYLLSALIFSAIHIIGYVGSVPILQLILSFLQYLPISFCLARAYIESKNILTSVLIHSIINFIAILSM